MSKKEDNRLVKADVAETSKQVADELEFDFMNDMKEQIETRVTEGIDAELVKQISSSIAHSIATELHQRIGDMIEAGIDERFRDRIVKGRIGDKAETGNAPKSFERTVPAQTARTSNRYRLPSSQAERVAMTGRKVRKEGNGVSGQRAGNEDALAELCQQILGDQIPSGIYEG